MKEKVGIFGSSTVFKEYTIGRSDTQEVAQNKLEVHIE